MIQQARQMRECRPVGEPLLDRVETRNLQATNQVGVMAHSHASIVAVAARSTEVQTVREPESTRVQTSDFDHEAVIERARALAGLTHGQLCAYMADEDGKALDQSLWTRMRRDGNLPIKRMRKCPDVFWRAFIVGLAESAGMTVSHDDIADLAVMRTADAFEAAAQAFRMMPRRRAV